MWIRKNCCVINANANPEVDSPDVYATASVKEEVTVTEVDPDEVDVAVTKLVVFELRERSIETLLISVFGKFEAPPTRLHDCAESKR